MKRTSDLPNHFFCIILRYPPSILLPQFLIDLLKSHRASQLEKRLSLDAKWVDRDLVFPNDFGEFIVPITLLRRFYRLLLDVGLPRMHFHDLRHSAATILISMGSLLTWCKSFWDIGILRRRWVSMALSCLPGVRM